MTGAPGRVHTRPLIAVCLFSLSLIATLAVPATAQRGGMFQGSADDPAINYRNGAVDNVVVDFNERLRDGSAVLTFEGRSGYLTSALAGLALPLDSQVLVFSPTSFQARRISAANPRALFFTDRVALGWDHRKH